MNLPRRPPVRVNSLAGLLAVIPHLLGFTPDNSLVVVGVGRTAGRVQVAFRYDLPDPPDASTAAAIADHAAAMLVRQRSVIAVAVGYGQGPRVTPVADAIRRVVPAAAVELRDVLRVNDGRYWSYLCSEPSCCPAEGVPFDAAAHPAAKILASMGQLALPDRAALAASIAPLTGTDADAMAEATRRAERAASRLIAHAGPQALDRPGLGGVRSAIDVYRDGGSITPAVRHAWLGLVLTRLRIRDDAWARMDPAHHDAHQRLWTDLVRRAQPGYVAAPACLLAVTAWQSGNGALANIALDRALADTPDYTMTRLLREALAAGVPPSAAAPSMTPEEVAASYAALATGQPADHAENKDPADPGSATSST